MDRQEEARCRPVERDRPGSRLTIALALFVALGSAVHGARAQQASATAEAKAESPFRHAEELLGRGQLDEAKADILETLKSHPGSAEGYDLLGVVSSEQKDFDHAVEAFQHALRLDPGSVRAHNDLGNVYAAQGKLDLAEKEFRAAVRAAPANRDANYNLGLMLMTRGHAGEAAKYLERIRPPDTPTLFALIRADLRSGQTAEGLKLATELSNKNKDDLRLHFTLGVMLASEKQYEAAQRELEAADALAPGTFEILYNLGQAYLRTQQDAKAELVLQRALKIHPDSPDALYLLAQVYADENRQVDGLELLVRARKLAPQNTDIIFLMARLSMMQNYYEDAIPLLEDGLKIAPKRPDLHAALGECYFMAGKVEKSIDEFQTLIQLDPSPRSYTFMGLSYRHLGRFDEAKKYFAEGLKRDPRDASCLYNLGYIASRQGNYGEAERYFQEALESNPNYADALLELASIRINQKKPEEAATLLRRYVKASSDPAAGYYKLAIVERGLHQMDAAERDMKVFQTLSKNSNSGGAYPYQHLFDYLNNRASLPATQRSQLDLAELKDQVDKHPEQPENLYMLAETYLKLGKPEEAKQTLAKLDQVSGGDFRTQAGVGVLLARYHLFPEAIAHFQAALHASPDSDGVKYDLADAYFQTGAYSQALEALSSISAPGRQDDQTLSLLGDVYAHLGQFPQAMQIFSDAIQRNPDNDQYYLSLALTQLRAGDLAAAQAALNDGLKRVPNSGRVLWGMGIVAAVQGNSDAAEKDLQRAVDLLPEWPGSYSALGVLYYQTGQVEKAREVLKRFAEKNPNGGLDVRRIEETLAQAPQNQTGPTPLSPTAKRQFLQIALSLADRTL